MKIYVFFRSNELSNQIASATKNFFAKDKDLKSLNIDFFNLDKRNYIKILKEAETGPDAELPKHIFIWYDEEKISDYIKETYSSINVVHYTKDISMNYKEKRYGYKTEYLLKDVIIELLKDMEKQTIYAVKGCEIEKLELDDIELSKYKGKGYICFNTKQEADEYLVNYLTKLIDSNKKYEIMLNKLKN